MKKVLIIAADGLGNSGVPHVIKDIVDSLVSYGYSFDIIVFEDYDYYTQYLIKQGCTIHHCCLLKPTKLLGRLIWKLFSKNKYLYSFFDRFFDSHNDYSVIHSFKEFDSGPIFKAAKKHSINKRIFHCNVIHEKPRNIVKRFIFEKDKKISLKYATHLIGVSQKCCENAFKKKRYLVFHNTFDEDKYFFKEYTGDNSISLIQVATFSSNKNQLFSLMVLKELCKIKPDSKLYLLGRENEPGYYQKMIDFINNNNLNKDVFFINQVSDLLNVLPKISFYILPSLKEGASIVSIEAQSCGMFVFASDTVSKDMNVGGCIFLSLDDDIKKWVNTIIYQNAISVRQHFDVSEFSKAKYQERLLRLYKNE